MDYNSNSVDVIVSHYNKYQDQRIRYMALHAMAYLSKDCYSSLNILLVDGSPIRDELLAEELNKLGVKYLHYGRELSFGEAYNVGIKNTFNQIVVTVANDILVESKQLYQLSAEISDRVGCAMPYLSFSDYGTQKARKLPVPRRCFPTRMTLNVNAFSREALEKIGYIPEEMTGCFNDVIVFIRLRQANYSIVLRNVGQVFHLGQQTLKVGTTVSYEKDAMLFSKYYPEYWYKDEVLFDKVAQSWTTKLTYRMIEYLPIGLRKRQYLWSCLWALEPYLCAEPGTYKEGIEKLLSLPRENNGSPRRNGIS